MDAQAHYMFQRNPNDAGPNAPQRVGGGGNGNGGPPSRSGMSVLVRTLVIIAIVLLGWYLFQYFFSQGSGDGSSDALEIPYSTFYDEVTSGNVRDVVFQGQDVTGNFKDSVAVTDATGAKKNRQDFSLYPVDKW